MTQLVSVEPVTQQWVPVSALMGSLERTAAVSYTPCCAWSIHVLICIWIAGDKIFPANDVADSPRQIKYNSTIIWYILKGSTLTKVFTIFQ